MSTPWRLDALAPAVRRQLEVDLLAVADTKLVLGNWLAECVANGRSLPDFAALLGMCTASYGHCRALYQYLTKLGHAYEHLERGRGAEAIASMNLLDAPPASWEDFLATTWLAELATWTLMSGFLDHPDRTVAGLARRMGEEAYFHLKYGEGWMRLTADSDEHWAAFAGHLEARHPLAVQWFGPVDVPDLLHRAGLRTQPVAALRAAFVERVARALPPGRPVPHLADGSAAEPDWRADARRCGPLPPGLYEVVRFKDPELAH